MPQLSWCAMMILVLPYKYSGSGVIHSFVHVTMFNEVGTAVNKKANIFASIELTS